MRLARQSRRLLLLLVFFSSTYGHAAETALYKELVQRAKAEGEVEYWSPMNEEPANKILAAFTQKFGIKTRFMRWVETGVQQRHLIEMQSGRSLRADLMAPNREAQHRCRNQR